MRKIKLLRALLFLIVGMCMLPCCSEGDPAPDTGGSNAVIPVAEVLPGRWILASSDESEWTTYEFRSSGQLFSEWCNNGKIQSGSGMYFTDDDQATVTGTINTGSDIYSSIDWIVKSIKPYQIDIDIYGDNGNQLILTTSLYKIIAEQEITDDAPTLPDYRGFSGSKDNSEFRSIDPNVATVDFTTGEIQGLMDGSTFIVFMTQGGYAAILVNVTVRKLPPLNENILGTWVTDNKGYIWERDVFGPDNYFYSNWSREIIYPTEGESGQGTYSINDATNVISVSAKTPYGQRIGFEYHIQTIDRYDFYAHVYSSGSKTGEFYFQRVLESITIDNNQTNQPDYTSLTDHSRIVEYKSHDEEVATVDAENGKITGISAGITYIDIITNHGSAVVEVTVE